MRTVGDSNGNGMTYKTSNVAVMLQVSTSTIRKYSMAIEKHGAVFMKDERQERLFNEQDISAFLQLRKHITGGKTMEESAKLVAISLINDKVIKSQEGEVLAQNDRSLFIEMTNQIETLTKQNQQMLEAIGEMNNRQSHMMAILNQMEASKLEETAPVVEVTATSEDETRGFFARLFRK